MQKKEFFDLIAPTAKKICKDRNYGYASFAVCLAQAACETGWGGSSLMMNAKAVFGIKATTSWKGKVYNAKTKECYDGHTYTTITDCFRAYDSYGDSVTDYFNLMTLNRYNQSLSPNNTVQECITIIKNGGYATSPTYINTIMSIYNDNKDLIDSYWNTIYNGTVNREQIRQRVLELQDRVKDLLDHI